MLVGLPHCTLYNINTLLSTSAASYFYYVKLLIVANIFDSLDPVLGDDNQ